MLRGRYWLARSTPQAIVSAREAFGVAVALDPASPDALAGLARAHAQAVLYSFRGPEDLYSELVLARDERAGHRDVSSSTRGCHTGGTLFRQHSGTMFRQQRVRRLTRNDMSESMGVRAAGARRTREALLAAAATEFVAQGVQAPIRDIAARAGVGLGTVYRHFPTRAELVVAVYRHQLDCRDAE